MFFYLFKLSKEKFTLGKIEKKSQNVVAFFQEKIYMHYFCLDSICVDIQINFSHTLFCGNGCGNGGYTTA